VSRGKIAWRDGRCSQRSASSILAPQRVPDREKWCFWTAAPSPSPEHPFMKIKSAAKAVWKPALRQRTSLECV
jgi:hypothetical protein